MTQDSANALLKTLHKLRAAENRDSLGDNLSEVLTLMDQVECVLRSLGLPLDIDHNPYLEADPE